MKIIFEKDVEEKPQFGDVDEDQFFVNWYGHLCQKVSRDQYNVIADKDGDPLGCITQDIDKDKDILGNFVLRILPKIAKIEF